MQMQSLEVALSHILVRHVNNFVIVENIGLYGNDIYKIQWKNKSFIESLVKVKKYVILSVVETNHYLESAENIFIYLENVRHPYRVLPKVIKNI